MTYLDGKLRVQGTHVITAIREFCRANPNGLQSTSHTTELVWYAMREELPGFYKLDSEPIGPVQGAVWKHETIQKFADYSLRVLLYEGDVLESDPEIHFHVGVHTCGPLQQVHKVRCIAPSLMVPGQIEKSAGDHGSIKTNSRLQVELRSPTDSALLDCPRGPPHNLFTADPEHPKSFRPCGIFELEPQLSIFLYFGAPLLGSLASCHDAKVHVLHKDIGGVGSGHGQTEVSANIDVIMLPIFDLRSGRSCVRSNKFVHS